MIRPNPDAVLAVAYSMAARGDPSLLLKLISETIMNTPTPIDPVLQADYEAVREGFPEHNLPAYEDLSPEQRDLHARAHNRHRQFMLNLGEAIRSGGKLPPLDLV